MYQNFLSTINEEVAMKKIIMISMSALIAIALALPAIAARPAEPTEPIKMALTAKTVTFNHTTHKTVDCAVCHHLVDGVENFQKCSDSGCHDAIGIKEKGINSYYRIAHDRKSETTCLGCHVKEAKAKPELRKALTGCKGSSCHP